MNNDSKTNDNATENNAELTLADLQELSAALGAAAAPSSGPSGGPAPTSVSTVMCPSHPWDR